MSAGFVVYTQVVSGPTIEVRRKVQALAIDSAININQIRASVRDRVLWFATAIVNHANNVRPNSASTKVVSSRMSTEWTDPTGLFQHL